MCEMKIQSDKSHISHISKIEIENFLAEVSGKKVKRFKLTGVEVKEIIS